LKNRCIDQGVRAFVRSIILPDLYIPIKDRLKKAFLSCLYVTCISIGFFFVSGFVHLDVLCAVEKLSYTVSIEGVTDRPTQKLLESVSQTISLRKSPPVSVNLLQRRINQDITIFRKVLRSQGYYGGRIRSKIHSDIRPIQVSFDVETGSPYVLDSVDIYLIGDDTGKSVTLPNIADIGLTLKEPARSKPILDAKHAIVKWYRRQGFPFPRVGEPEVVVDHQKVAVTVAFGVEPGIKAPFGDTRFSGLESVDEAYIRGKIPWKEGDPFNARLLRIMESRLIKTGLFSFAHVKDGASIDQHGRIPVIVQLRERTHRTVKAGASYRTDEGPGGSLSWEHRNILGQGERLRLLGLASEISLAAEGRFRMPEFYRSDQELLLSMRLAEDSPDAFKSRNITSIVQIDRKLTERLDLGAGIALRVSEIEQLDQEERFHLIYLPVHLRWDTSDHLLDPSRGGRMALHVAPFYDFREEDLFFYKGSVRLSRYMAVSEAPPVVLALGATVGLMSGAERDEIPADIRFYAGGGGSIRGYAFQSVGPTHDDQPIGGRSLVTMTAELRVKITERMGLVTFIDGGSAFESAFPDFEETLQWGGGLGFRYFTAIGPLRLDVGIPLNRREDMDDRFQIYVSIGQAF
jgi:translocation and assembly module TamA